MSAILERDHALNILEAKSSQLSKLYRECYLSMGRGALMAYTTDVIENGVPNEHNYRTKEEILGIFNAPTSHAKLGKMIDNYEQKREGIMTLITSFSNATFFVTFKLK